MSFFSVSFLFLSLWFSLSGCGFIFFCSLLFFQAVVLVLFFFCLVSFALVRLWSCGFGSVFLSCVLCSCQAVFSCLVPFVFVRWLNFLGCGLAVFCFFLLFSGCNVLFCSG